MCTACHGNKENSNCGLLPGMLKSSLMQANSTGCVQRTESALASEPSLPRDITAERCIRVWGDKQPALPQPISDPFEQSTFDACLLSCWIFTAEHFQIGTEKSEVKASYSRDCGVLKSVESSNEVCMEI